MVISCQKCLTPVKISCDITGWALVEYILFCFLLWWIFYWLLLITTRQSPEWCCRFVTCTHGCLVSYCAVSDICLKEPISFVNGSLSEAQKLYLSYMLSYFLFDFCWIHIFGNEKLIIYVHHMISILIIVYVLVRRCGGNGISYATAFTELSNPYLQLRWFLRSHGYLNKSIYTITELWFVFFFSVLRMIGGSIIVYRGVQTVELDWGMKISLMAVYVISLVLQWQICGFVKKKYIDGETHRAPFSPRSRDSISPYFQRTLEASLEDPNLRGFVGEGPSPQESSSNDPKMDDTPTEDNESEHPKKRKKSPTPVVVQSAGVEYPSLDDPNYNADQDSDAKGAGFIKMEPIGFKSIMEEAEEEPDKEEIQEGENVDTPGTQIPTHK